MVIITGITHQHVHRTGASASTRPSSGLCVNTSSGGAPHRHVLQPEPVPVLVLRHVNQTLQHQPVNRMEPEQVRGHVNPHHHQPVNQAHRHQHVHPAHQITVAEVAVAEVIAEAAEVIRRWWRSQRRWRWSRWRWRKKINS